MHGIQKRTFMVTALYHDKRYYPILFTEGNEGKNNYQILETVLFDDGHAPFPLTENI